MAESGELCGGVKADVMERGTGATNETAQTDRTDRTSVSVRLRRRGEVRGNDAAQQERHIARAPEEVPRQVDRFTSRGHQAELIWSAGQ